MAQNMQKYHVPICAKEKVFTIFNTKKLQPKKQKFRPFLVIFFGKFIYEYSCKKHSRLILICEINFNSFRITNTVCNLMHQ